MAGVYNIVIFSKRLGSISKTAFNIESLYTYLMLAAVCLLEVKAQLM